MATRTQNITNLKTRRDAVIAELAALSTSTAGGLPNSSGPGLHLDHQGYKKGLYQELRDIEEQLSRLSPGIITHQEF